jgi:hypothetical protein
METKKCFSSPCAFKAYATGKEEPGDSLPILNEWGGHGYAITWAPLTFEPGRGAGPTTIYTCVNSHMPHPEGITYCN